MASSSVAYATADDALSQLLTEAGSRKPQALPYAGEVTPQEAYDYLLDYPALLVDVRTQGEWQFIGVPDVSKTLGKLITLSWNVAPDYAVNLNFISQLYNDYFIEPATPLFFICRSGGRSLDAAIAASQAGFRYCFNISGGFEGAPAVAGWKASQLPWTQG